MAISLVLLFVLICVSAFFSGSEIAIFSLSELDIVEIEKSKKKNRNVLIQLLNNKERLLNTILIGNNIVNIAASALNTKLAISYASSSKQDVDLFVLFFSAILTVIIIFVGEITPKNLAVSYNRSFSLFAAPFIYLFEICLSPLLFFFYNASKVIRFIFGLNNNNEKKISESTVIHVVSKGEEQGVINHTEKLLIENVFLFDERAVNSVMTPRRSIFAFQEDIILKDAIPEIIKTKFSRIPLYSDSIDQITGVINLKDIFEKVVLKEDHLPLSSLAQKPEFLYETLPLATVLEKMKETRHHLIVVVDEFGGTEGIVTMEDVLEELVGEIFDEKDEITTDVKMLGEDKWLVLGLADLVTINKSLPYPLPVDDAYETIQGLMMSKLDKIPSVGDRLKESPYKCTVMKMKENEIQYIMLEKVEDVIDDD